MHMRALSQILVQLPVSASGGTPSLLVDGPTDYAPEETIRIAMDSAPLLPKDKVKWSDSRTMESFWIQASGTENKRRTRLRQPSTEQQTQQSRHHNRRSAKDPGTGALTPTGPAPHGTATQ